jgi:hypothetical protein
VSTFFTLAKPSAEGPDGKRLNLRKLAADGTPFATCRDGARRMRSYFTALSGGYMKSILDPSFRYTKSVETDLRKTFARVRRELRKQTLQSANVEAMRKILPFQSRKDAA